MKKGNISYSDRVALFITDILGTMTCAVIFCIIALLSLPSVIAAHNLMIFIQWLSGSFIQLVALAILGKGQKLQSIQGESLDEKIYRMELAQLKMDEEQGRELDEILTILRKSGRFRV